jgi:uncharacterized membrane protein YfbV (UPF0208 family)
MEGKWTVVTLNQALDESGLFVDQKEDPSQPISLQGHSVVEMLLQRALTPFESTALTWWDVLVRSLVKNVFLTAFEALSQEEKNIFEALKKAPSEGLGGPCHYDTSEEPAPDCLKGLPFTRAVCEAVITTQLPFPFEFIWHYELIVTMEQVYETLTDVQEDLKESDVYVKNHAIVRRKTIKSFIRI